MDVNYGFSKVWEVIYIILRGVFLLGFSYPAIDRCTSGGTPDLDIRERWQGAHYDMGAFDQTGISSTYPSYYIHDLLIAYKRAPYI